METRVGVYLFIIYNIPLRADNSIKFSVFCQIIVLKTIYFNSTHSLAWVLLDFGQKGFRLFWPLPSVLASFLPLMIHARRYEVVVFYRCNPMRSVIKIVYRYILCFAVKRLYICPFLRGRLGVISFRLSSTRIWLIPRLDMVFSLTGTDLPGYCTPYITELNHEIWLSTEIAESWNWPNPKIVVFIFFGHSDSKIFRSFLWRGLFWPYCKQKKL